MKIARIGELKCKVGEGPVWDAERQLLYFVDIRGQRLYRHTPASDRIENWAMPQPIGSLAPCSNGELLLALADGIYSFDFKRPPVLLARPGDESATFNDGKTDRSGRFIAGTASGFANPVPSGSLYRFERGVGLANLFKGIAVPNGPCFSPDGRVFYCADSREMKIHAWDYDTAKGQLANQRTFLDTHTMFGAASDGATVDADGCLWVTLVAASKIVQVRPDGTVERVIETPVPWPSSVMFGGANLEHLYFTSIDGAVYDMATNAASGGLFVIEGLGTRA